MKPEIEALLDRDRYELLRTEALRTLYHHACDLADALLVLSSENERLVEDKELLDAMEERLFSAVAKVSNGMTWWQIEWDGREVPFVHNSPNQFLRAALNGARRGAGELDVE